jgi:hypothetical protein
MMRRLVLAMLLGGWACSGGGNRAAEPVVRDSAGIRIVENLDVGWQDGAAWTVAQTPALDLGGVDAEAAHQFHMMMGAATLTDGRIVVANAGTQELRWFDGAGTLVARAGGEGQGPGEFTGLTSIGLLPGDSVIAYDGRQRRFSVFDASGAFVRSAPFDGDERPGMRFPVFMGMLNGGSFVMVGRDLQTEGMTEGPVVAAMPVYVYGSDGEARDSLGTFHGWEALVTIRRSGEVVGMSIGDRPYGRSTTVTSVGDGIVVGTPDAYEFEVYAPDGALRTIVRLARPNAPLTSTDIDAYVASQMEDDADDNLLREHRRLATEIDFPDTKPAYASAIRGDVEGNVWVPGFSIEDGEEQHPPLWAVFDRDGRFLGELAMPRRLRVREIGADYVLGVWRDDFDVEHLRRYALTKPDRP